jgi:glycyl-tRNA synthetase beta subunit
MFITFFRVGEGQIKLVNGNENKVVKPRIDDATFVV